MIFSTEWFDLSKDKFENLQTLVSVTFPVPTIEVLQTFSGEVQIAFPVARLAATLMLSAQGSADT